MTFVVLDAKGRCVIPRHIRMKSKTRRFEILEESDGCFILVPILPLKKLRGAFKTGATWKEWEEFHALEKNIS